MPQFARSTFAVINDGWDSVALEADAAWIFKFPRNDAAANRLRRECAVLEALRPGSPVPLPQMALQTGSRLFSMHRKIPGGQLLGPQYAALTELQRDHLADRLGSFYAWLHALPPTDLEAVGAQPIAPWLAPEQVLERAMPVVPPPLRPQLEHTLARFAAMQAAGDDTIFGYFDGHGWNMAFDHDRGELRGLYDFADSGLGPRHQDLSYGNWIAPDLTRRMLPRYLRHGGRPVDPDQVMLYSAMLRFVEVAEAAPDSPDLPARLASLADWFAAAPPR